MLYFIKNYFLAFYSTKSCYWILFSPIFNNIPGQSGLDKPVFNNINRLNHFPLMNNIVTNKISHFRLRNTLKTKMASMIKHKQQTRYIRLQA